MILYSMNIVLFNSPEPKAEELFLIKISLLFVVIIVVNCVESFFSKTTGPILTKHGTKHPWKKVFQILSNEESYFVQMGDD